MKKSFLWVFFLLFCIGLLYADGDENYYNFVIPSWPSQTSDGVLIFYEVNIEWFVENEEKYRNKLNDEELAEMILSSSIKTNLIILSKEFMFDELKSLLLKENDADLESEDISVANRLEELVMSELDYGLKITVGSLILIE